MESLEVLGVNDKEAPENEKNEARDIVDITIQLESKYLLLLLLLVGCVTKGAQEQEQVEVMEIFVE